MEMRHYLALARMHNETELAKRVTEANRFYVRLSYPYAAACAL